MSGTLYMVATPIGNLEDITLRALRVLREVDLIAAEDTRRTTRLLAHHGIPTPTISFHEHNSRARIPLLLQKLSTGSSVALVTDAGTPGVSDPGVELVAACIEADIPVDPVPGVSAPLTAAVASGFPMDSLTLLGFPPHKSKARKEWLKKVMALDGTVTFFESPHRIKATLSEASALFGIRPIVIGRELTKVHQEFLRGNTAEVLAQLGEPRGEYTLVVGPRVMATEVGDLPDDATVAREFGDIANNSAAGRREAVATVAKKYQKSAREVYAAIVRARNMVNDRE